MEYKNALSTLAGKKTASENTMDVFKVVGDKAKKDKQWQEFADWINGKDATGGPDAQEALAKSRANKIMKQYGPKLIVPGMIGTPKPQTRKVATSRLSDRVDSKSSSKAPYTRPAPKTNFAKMHWERIPTPTSSSSVPKNRSK